MKDLSQALLGSAALVLGLAISFPALAQDEEHHGPMHHGFERADKDGDGAISRDEFMANHHERFAAVDADADGNISAEERAAKREEMRAKMEERRAKREARMKERAKKMLEQVDTNGDGVVSAQEHEAHAAARFAKWDKNGDGQLTQDEMPYRMHMGDGPHHKRQR